MQNRHGIEFSDTERPTNEPADSGRAMASANHLEPVDSEQYQYVGDTTPYFAVATDQHAAELHQHGMDLRQVQWNGEFTPQHPDQVRWNSGLGPQYADQAQYRSELPTEYPYQGQHDVTLISQYPDQAQYGGELPPEYQYQGQPHDRLISQYADQAQYGGELPPEYPYQGQHDDRLISQYADQAQYSGELPAEYQYQGQQNDRLTSLYPDQAQYGGELPPEYPYQGQHDDRLRSQYSEQVHWDNGRLLQYPDEVDRDGGLVLQHPYQAQYDGELVPQYPDQAQYNGELVPEYSDQAQYDGDLPLPYSVEAQWDGALTLPSAPEVEEIGELGLADAARSEGNRLYASDDFAGALHWYSEALSILGDRLDTSETVSLRNLLLTNACACQLALGQPEKAFQLARIVLAQDPENVKCLYRSAVASMHLGEVNQAFADSCVLWKVDPEVGLHLISAHPALNPELWDLEGTSLHSSQSQEGSLCGSHTKGLDDWLALPDGSRPASAMLSSSRPISALVHDYSSSRPISADKDHWSSDPDELFLAEKRAFLSEKNHEVNEDAKSALDSNRMQEDSGVKGQEAAFVDDHWWTEKRFDADNKGVVKKLARKLGLKGQILTIRDIAAHVVLLVSKSAISKLNEVQDEEVDKGPPITQAELLALGLAPQSIASQEEDVHRLESTAAENASAPSQIAHVPHSMELAPQHTIPDSALVSAHEFLLAKCNPIQARALFREALSLLQQKREVGLTELWMQAWRGLVVCGVLLKDQGMIIDNAGAMLALEPIDSWALAMRAQAAQELADTAAAREDWKAAALLEPRHPLLQEWSAERVDKMEEEKEQENVECSLDHQEDDDDHVSLCSSTSSITDQAMWRSQEIEEWNLGNQLPKIASDAEESDAEERAALPADSESDEEEEKKEREALLALQSGIGADVLKKGEESAAASVKADDEDDMPSLSLIVSNEEVQGGANPQDCEVVNIMSQQSSSSRRDSSRVLRRTGTSNSVRFASNDSVEGGNEVIEDASQGGSSNRRQSGDIVLDLSRPSSSRSVQAKSSVVRPLSRGNSGVRSSLSRGNSGVRSGGLSRGNSGVRSEDNYLSSLTSSRSNIDNLGSDQTSGTEPVSPSGGGSNFASDSQSVSASSDKTEKTQKTEKPSDLNLKASPRSPFSRLSLQKSEKTPQSSPSQASSFRSSKMSHLQERSSKLLLAFWKAKGSSELLEHLVIFGKRLAFVWDFFTDCLLIVQLLSNGYYLWGQLVITFAILPYPCMSWFVGKHYIAKIQERKGLPHWAAFILWYSFSIFFFLYNDIIILFEYMFAEPSQNELFTYIRVRQLNMVLFEAIPQSVLGLVILISQQGEDTQVIDTKVVVTSFLSSALSTVLYAVVIRKYARVHCEGSVYQYVLCMMDLGKGLAPTSLIHNILRMKVARCNFDFLSERAFGEISTAMASARICEQVHISTTINDQAAAQLVRAVRVHSSLRDLHLPNLKMSRRKILMIINALGQNPTLRLHIWEARFQKRDAPLLEKILRNDVAGGHIGDDKVSIAARLIKLTPYLQQLDLSKNQIGDQGAQELALAVQTEGTILQRLVLDGNKIGDIGAEALGTALLKSTVLNFLSIERNTPMTKDGCGKLLCAVRACGKLIVESSAEKNKGSTELQILGCTVKPLDARWLLALLQNDLDGIGGPDLGDHEMGLLQTAIKESPLLDYVNFNVISPPLKQFQMIALLRAGEQSPNLRVGLNFFGYTIRRSDFTVVADTLEDRLDAAACWSAGPEEVAAAGAALADLAEHGALRTLRLPAKADVSTSIAFRLLKAFSVQEDRKIAKDKEDKKQGDKEDAALDNAIDNAGVSLNIWGVVFNPSQAHVVSRMLSGGLSRSPLTDEQAQVVAQALAGILLPDFKQLDLVNVKLSRSAICVILTALEGSQQSKFLTVNLWGHAIRPGESRLVVRLLKDRLSGLRFNARQLWLLVRMLRTCGLPLHLDLSRNRAVRERFEQTLLPLVDAIAEGTSPKVTILLRGFSVSKEECRLYGPLLGARPLCPDDFSSDEDARWLPMLVRAIRTCSMCRTADVSALFLSASSRLAILAAAESPANPSLELRLWPGVGAPLRPAECRSVRELLKGVLLGSEITDENVDVIARVLSGTNWVEFLDLQECNLSLQSAQLLAEALERSPGLKQLLLQSSCGNSTSNDSKASMYHRRHLVALWLRAVAHGAGNDRLIVELGILTLERHDCFIAALTVQDRLRDCERLRTRDVDMLCRLLEVFGGSLIPSLELRGCPPLLRRPERLRQVLLAAERGGVTLTLSASTPLVGLGLTVARQLHGGCLGAPFFSTAECPVYGDRSNALRSALICLRDDPAPPAADLSALELEIGAVQALCHTISRIGSLDNVSSKDGVPVGVGGGSALQSLTWQKARCMTFGPYITRVSPVLVQEVGWGGLQSAVMDLEDEQLAKDKVVARQLLAAAAAREDGGGTSLPEAGSFELNLWGYGMTAAECRTVGQLLEDQPALGSSVGRRELSMICRALACTCLADGCDLRGNDTLTVTDAEEFAKDCVESLDRAAERSSFRSLSGIQLHGVASGDIQSLDLTDQQLGDFEAAVLAHVLRTADNAHVRNIDLRGNKLTPAVLMPWLSLIKEYPTLRIFDRIPVGDLNEGGGPPKLDLKGSRLLDFDGLLLVQLLQGNVEMLELDLRRNPSLGVISAEAFAMLLGPADDDMVPHSIEARHTCAVMPALTRCNRSIQLFSGMDILAVRQNQVKNMEISNMELSDFEVRVLAGILQFNSSVQVLNLRQNPLVTKEGVSELQALLVSNKHIEELCGLPMRDLRELDTAGGTLDMKQMGLGDAEILMLVALLHGKSGLVNLDLRMNGHISSTQEMIDVILHLLAAPWAPHIFCQIPARAMQADRLRELDLRSQSLGAYEATLLVTLLNGGSAPSLEYLWLQDNLFSMSSGGAFFSPIKRWKVMTTRWLEHNRSDHEKRIRDGEADQHASGEAPNPEDLFWDADAFELGIDGTAALWAARQKWRVAGGGGEHCRILCEQWLSLCRKHKGLQMLSDMPIRELLIDSEESILERQKKNSDAHGGQDAKKRWSSLRVTTALTKGKVRDQLIDLDLRGKNLGDFELVILADILEHNGVLQNVDLRGSQSSEDAAVRWALMLEKNTALQTVSTLPVRSIMQRKEERLDFRGRDLGDFEVCLIAEILEIGYASGVKSLDLRDNDLTVPAARRMLRILITPPHDLDVFEELNGIPVNDLRDIRSMESAALALVQAAKAPTKSVELERLDDFGSYIVASLLGNSQSNVRRVALPRPRVSLRGGARAIGGFLAKILAAPAPPRLEVLQFGGLTINPAALRQTTGVLDLRRHRLGHLESVALCCALAGLEERTLESAEEPEELEEVQEHVQDVLTTPLALSPPPGKAVETSEVLLRSLKELLDCCPCLRQWGPIQINGSVDFEGKLDLSSSLIGDLELLILIQLFRSGRLQNLQCLVLPGGALLSEVAVCATLLMLSESPIESIAEQWGGLPLRMLTPGPQSITLVDLDLRAGGLGDYEAMTLAAVLPEGSPSLRSVDLRQNPRLTSIAAACLGPAWVKDYVSLQRLSTLPVRLLLSKGRQGGGINIRGSIAGGDEGDDQNRRQTLTSMARFSISSKSGDQKLKRHATGAPTPDIPHLLADGKSDSDSLVESNILDISGRRLGSFEASLLTLFLRDGCLAATIHISQNPDVHGHAARELAEVLYAVAGPVVEVSGIPLIGAGFLTELNLKDHGLGNAEGMLLSTFLRRHMALVSCDLRGNVFEHDVAEALADAVGSNAALETFSGIPVRVLKKSQVRFLDLSYQQLGDTEVLILARLLRGCTSLYSLDLNGNPRLTQWALSKVLEILLHQSSAVARLGCWNLFSLRQVVTDQMEELEPAAPVVGDVDASVLAEVLCETQELKNVSLFGSEMKPDAQTIASKLIRALVRNTSLRSLNGIPLRALFQRANTEEPFCHRLDGRITGDSRTDWSDFEAHVLLALVSCGAVARPLISLDFPPGVLSADVATEASYVLGKSQPAVQNFNGLPIARLCNDTTLTHLQLGRLQRRRITSLFESKMETASCSLSAACELSVTLDPIGTFAGEAAQAEVPLESQSNKSEENSQDFPAENPEVEQISRRSDTAEMLLRSGTEELETESMGTNRSIMSPTKAEGQSQHKERTVSGIEGSEGAPMGELAVVDEEKPSQPCAVFEFELRLLSSLLPAAQSLTDLEICLSDEEFSSLSNEAILKFHEAALSPSGPPLKHLCGMPADILRAMRIGHAAPLEIDFRGLGLRDFEGALLAPLVRRTALLNGLRRVDLRGHCFGDTAALAFEEALAQPVELEDFSGLPLKALRAGNEALTELELSEVDGPLGNFEVYLATSWLLENSSVQELRFPPGLILDSDSMTAERLRMILRSEMNVLEVVAGIPVGPLSRDELEELTLSDEVLGDVEGVVLTEILGHSRERLQRLALVCPNGDMRERIWRMFRSAAVVLSAIKGSGLNDISVTLWGQELERSNVPQIQDLMLAQLNGTKPTFVNPMNTPLARLCWIPVSALEEDRIDEINVRGQGLTDFEMIILTDLLRRNRSVRRVDLRQNPLVSAATALDFALSVVRRGDSKLLDVSGIPVRSLSHSQNFDLSNLALGDFEAVILKELFPTCNKLRAVELKNNCFTQRGAEVLVEALQYSATLEEYSGIPVRELATNRLTELSMIGRELGNLEAFLLAELLKGNSTITQLDISKNRFSSPSAAASLGDALIGSWRLATYNNIMDLGALRDGSVTVLNLSQRGLGDFDAVLISTILKSERCKSRLTIEEVDFAKNQISISGFLALVGAFTYLPKLKRIDIRPGEPLSGDDVLDLLQALTGSLKGRGIFVNLFGWDVGIELLETLLRLLRNELSNEALSVDQVEAVVKALRVSEFGIEHLTVRGILLAKSEVLTILRGVVACEESEPGRNLVLNAWGYPMTPDDCSAVLTMLENDTSDVVDVFKVGAIVGSQRYKNVKSPPKVTSTTTTGKPTGQPKSSTR